MADPTPYIVSYSFSGFQASNPTTPLPAARVDAEFANVAAAVATLVSATKDIRRSDGALKNQIVTFDSLEAALQLTFDPTNGQLVAAAVATAQAAATAASGSATGASGSALAAANSAAAAAASAAGINLTLYLAKANNLAGLGNNDSALANIGAMKIDGSTATGRLAPTATAVVTDWNAVTTSGWYAGNNAANGPTVDFWLVQTIAYGTRFITQIGYNVGAASTGVDAVTPYRRHSYDTGSAIAWQPWQSMGPVPVGSTIWINGITAPPGFVKENGALLSRASFPGLYAFAAASNNIVSEVGWAAGQSGSFSTGDLATTFRVPDSRGEFIRAWDNARGVDSGRNIGSNQADALRDHTHNYSAPTATNTGAVVNGSASLAFWTGGPVANTSTGANIGAAETRPRSIPKLACIKY